MGSCASAASFPTAIVDRAGQSGQNRATPTFACASPDPFTRGPPSRGHCHLRGMSFPKILSGRIRAMRQNQRIMLRDACIPSAAWDVCRQPVQVAAPA